MKNTGIILEDRHPGDYIYGGFSYAPQKRIVTDWSSFLPTGEEQQSKKEGFQNCTTFSAVHALETQINYDIAQGKYQKESLDYFESAGYMEDGKFRISVRYNTVMNGTTRSGQYMSVTGDGLRHDGLLPNRDMPLTDGMYWNDYYTPPTPVQIAKAKLIYKYLDVSYQWVDPYNLSTAVLNAPIQIATAFCDGWGTDNPVKACGYPIAHCTMVYGLDANDNYYDFDSFPPYQKKLASNYHIFSAMQYIVSPQVPPSLFSKVLAIIKKAYNVK